MLAALRYGFVLGVSGLVVHAALFASFDARRLAWFAAAWIVAAPLWVLLARLLPDRPRSVATFGLWLSCAVLVGVEAGLRAAAALRPSPYFARADPRLERQIQSRLRTPGTYYWGFPVNSDGWYDEEFGPRRSGRHRVLSVSDSFAWGAVPHHHHFTTVCERALGDTEVLNLGWSATGIDAYAYLVEHWCPVLEPDLIVVNLFLGNDLVEMIPRGHAGLRRWFSRESLLAYLVPRRLLRSYGEARTATRAPPGNLGWGAGVQRPVATGQLEAVYPWLADPRLERPTFSEAAFLRIESERATSLRVARDPRWRADFFARVRAIVDHAAPTPVLFVLLPDEFQVDDSLWAEIERSVPDLPARGLPQRVVTRWLSRHRIDHLDLLPALRAARPPGGGAPQLYHLRDTHFNRRGNEVAGLALAEALAARLRH